MPGVAKKVSSLLAAVPRERSGGEPTKSFKKVMPLFLESDYIAKVLMFYCPVSKSDCLNGFPKDKAAQVSSIAEISEAVKTNLLPHIMGNIDCESYLIVSKEKSFASALLHATILNSFVTASEGHAELLRKLDFLQHVYFIVNDGDNRFFSAEVHERSTCLGKNLTEDSDNHSAKLTLNVAYIDVKTNGVNHLNTPSA